MGWIRTGYAPSDLARTLCLKNLFQDDLQANKGLFPDQSGLASLGRGWLAPFHMAAIHLPERCGVMFLPDCTLFPHGGLPLYIFEKRYRRMLEEALEGDCFFAVARLLGDETGHPANFVAPVGTIGLVRASREQDDGTSQLLLHGVMRVRFTDWHDGNEYPCASIEPVISVFSPENQALAAMLTLRGAVEDAVVHLPESIQSGIFELLSRADDPGLLTDVICQQFIQEPDLRQKLLETVSIGDRIPVICDYLGHLRLARDD